MYRFLIFLLPTVFFIYPAHAQPVGDSYISNSPVCFKVKNTAPYTVFGEVSTAGFIREDGQQITHEATFRLKENEETPMCSTGPFFEGGKLRLTLRTLVPLFECKTVIYEGMELIIRGKLGDGTTSTKTWAECYE
jgi:hypothetical protein